MAFEITIPPLGDQIEDATISLWHVKSGEQVEQGQDIVEISTDKATFNISAPADGVLSQTFYEEGDNVEVGEVIAMIEDQEDLIDDSGDDDSDEE